MSHLPIRVNTLRGDQKIDFDVHIKINDRMILYIRQGDSFEGPRLQRLKERKLKKLFIAPEQEENYRAYVQRNLDIAYDDASGKDIQTARKSFTASSSPTPKRFSNSPATPTPTIRRKKASRSTSISSRRTTTRWDRSSTSRTATAASRTTALTWQLCPSRCQKNSAAWIPKSNS